MFLRKAILFGTRPVWLFVAVFLLAFLALTTARLRANTPVVAPTDRAFDGPGKNVDGVCFWVDPADPAHTLIFSETKDSGLVEVFNVVTGEFVATITGFGLPNNCAVAGDLLLTTDRIANEVKVHHIPDLTFLRAFGQDMTEPEGVDILNLPSGQQLAYVTDSDDISVHVYDVATGELLNVFPTGLGVGIEPLVIDDLYGRVYIGWGEKERTRGIRVFDLDGNPLFEFGAPVFSLDVEGMALYKCGDRGYLIASDQRRTANDFEIFDRVTLEHLGTFAVEDGNGGFTDSTDGVDILQTPIPGFPNGVLAMCDGCGSSLPDEMDVISWDRVAEVMGLDLCPGGAAPDCASTPCSRRVTATADAFVNGASPSVNFGTANTLEVEVDPPSVRETLIRIDVPDLTGFDIIEAVLRLTVVGQRSAGSDDGGTLYLTTGDWTESEVTFDTRPLPAGGAIGSAGPVARSESIDFDVGGVVTADGTYDFLLRNSSADKARYYSREAALGAPTLFMQIKAKEPPQVSIASPAAGAVVRAGDSVALAGSATDADGTDLSSSILWSSDLDGALGEGADVIAGGLSIGAHVITAEVDGATGLTGAGTVEIVVDGPPTLAITAPSTETVIRLGDAVSLAATATDGEDGDIGGTIVWTSSRDGSLGTGGDLSVSTLSGGTHAITATATDSAGNQASETITVVVDASPSVTITGPADGSVFLPGEAVTLAGIASDATGADLTTTITWDSDLDGALGNGGSITVATLGTGQHTITASVTDSGGMGQASVVIIVDASPSVAITAPPGGTLVRPGDVVTLVATATDPEDGDLGAGIAWASDRDGALGGGARLAVNTLSAGSHVISASASDSRGRMATATIVVIVNAPPIVTITQPVAGSVFPPGAPVAFVATASDPEDGDLSAMIAWTSDLDGDIGYGASVSIATLTPGAHTVTATVADRAAVVGTASLSVLVDAAPVVTIAAPAGGSTFALGESIALTATATDLEDGDLTVAIEWVSSLDGPIGTGGAIATGSLRSGVHTLTATVTDSRGQSGVASVAVTVNAAPTLIITDPREGAAVEAATPITLAATANDAEDGDLSATITWVSSLDGFLGTGSSLVVSVLSIGTHTLTASVTDANGASGTRAVTITVQSVPAISITAPPDGVVVAAGMVVNLAAVGSDPVDGSLGEVIEWVSSLDGFLGTGSPLPVTLSEGAHVLTARVTNSAGVARSAQVSLEVISAPPVVAILQPLAGSVAVAGTVLRLVGTAVDAKDGEINDAIIWASDRAGRLGTGSVINVEGLALGTHVITASATDTDFQTSVQAVQIEIVPATVVLEAVADTYIDAGAPAVSFGNSTELLADGSPERQAFLRFDVAGVHTAEVASAILRLQVSSVRASASDQGGILYVVGETTWDELATTYANRPAIDGAMMGSQGAVVVGDIVEFDVTSAVAGDGPVAFALVTQSSNAVKYQSREAPDGWPTLVLTLRSPDVPDARPRVSITTPADGTAVRAGAPVTLAATATDNEDGDLSGAVVWSSNGMGDLGVGATITLPAIPAGAHSFVASVTDSDGLRGSATVDIVATAAPVVSILDPPDGSQVDGPVTFTGSASDQEDGDVGGSIVWISDVQGQLGTGSTITTEGLTLGTHVITAHATDADGMSGEAQVVIDVMATTLVFEPEADAYVESSSPDVNFGALTTLVADRRPKRQALLRFDIQGSAGAIVEQAILAMTVSTASSAGSIDGGTIYEITDSSWEEATVTYQTRPAIDGPELAAMGPVAAGDRVEFEVTGAAVVDGPLNLVVMTTSSDAVKYSSREARIGGPTLSVRVRLPEIPNTVPSVAITAPSDGAVVDAVAPLGLAGSATDAEDGDLSGAIEWSSDRDGALGTGAYLTAALSVGAHVLTASVVDSRGVASMATVTVTAVDRPPVMAILTPADGTVFGFGEAVSLSAKAVDAIDGDRSAGIQWVSSLDGALGTGQTLIASALSVGSHEITASAADGSGLVGTAVVEIAITRSSSVFASAGDAFVVESVPGARFGADTHLIVKGGSPEIKTFLRFDVSGTEGAVVARARLRLTVDTSASAGSDSGGLVFAVPDATWDELAMTYNNLPQLGAGPLDSAGPVTQGDVVEFDVTPVVHGDGAYSFAVLGTVADAVVYRSRESATGAPELILSFVAP